MGLTHYWRRPPRLPTAMFCAAVEDVRRILSTVAIKLAGRDGTGEPILLDSRISFNGRTPLACEAFEIASSEWDRLGNPEVTSFCKTGGLPYDLCVKAALIILNHHLHQHLSVASDQAIDGWHSARDIVQVTLGYVPTFALSTV